MKLNLFEIQTKIFDYLQTKYKEINPDFEMIWDLLDLDKYKKSNAIFVQFTNVSFNNLTRSCNEMTQDLELFFVCRNAKTEELKKTVLNAASEFYNFYNQDCCLGGIIDTGTITGSEIFEAVEGNTSIKIVKTNLSLKLEL